MDEDRPPGTPARGQGPLAGVRVVELAGLGPGPYGVMLLADLGADVVRIDRPPGGEALPPGDPRAEVLARGKRSVALDLKTAEGLDAARALVDRADVLVDPYRPGVTERLGLGPDACLERNPGLVYARMTGWGQDGPLAAVAGHDIDYIALAGALHPIGAPDAPPPPPLNLVGDFGGGGMLLAFGVAAALVERASSGRGQVLDVAMVDGAASLLASLCQLDAQGQWSHERGTNWLDGAAPWYGTYRTADDRFVAVGALEGKFHALLLERLGLDPADWPQWEPSRWPAQRAALAERFATRTLDEWRELLEGTDASFAPVLRVDEAAEHPHVAARGTFERHDGVLQPAPVPRFSRTPGAVQGAPPLPGEHTGEVLAELHAASAPHPQELP